jgi:hypothetical protein
LSCSYHIIYPSEAIVAFCVSLVRLAGVLPLSSRNLCIKSEESMWSAVGGGTGKKGVRIFAMGEQCHLDAIVCLYTRRPCGILYSLTGFETEACKNNSASYLCFPDA